MLKVFLLFCYVICLHPALSQNHSGSPKIVGGSVVTNPREFPFMVSLRKNYVHICGGSIIDYRHVLTAAHCCYNSLNKPHPAKSLSIAAGNLNIGYADNSMVIMPVKKVIVHEYYDPEYVLNDLAIIRILGEFPQWHSNIQPISLSNYVPRSGYCTICGWGVMKFNTTALSSNLRMAIVPIVEEKQCRAFYGNQLSRKMICAGGSGVDSCQGDSGGPLICNYVLAGIVSWGSGCAVYPGVYTAVAEYKSWISQHVNSSSQQTSCTILQKFVFFLVALIHAGIYR